MDAFFVALHNLCQQLLPILGSVVLVVLIILLINIVKVVRTVDTTLLKSHTTIDLANQSIDKIQAPLDTAVKVSGGIDKGLDAGAKALAEAKDYVVKNADSMKEKISSLRSKPAKETALSEPTPEELIEGGKEDE